MGFNIGISAFSDDLETEFDCDVFLERTYYNWIIEYETLGEESCIVQTGKLLNINLKPLTEIIYLGDELDQISIPSNLQNIDFLIALLNSLINEVNNNPTYINQIKNTELKMKWRKYILNGEFIKHLEEVLKSLNCYKSKGYKEVFFWFG